MPSTATITAFYTFVANTRAKAAEVNSNFNIFRGHILPVDPNTTTAINNTYDLGSTDYIWRNLYVGNVRKPAESGTTTASAGQFALSSLFTGNFLEGGATTGGDLAGSTVTISTIGRPVEVGLISAANTFGSIQCLLAALSNTSTSRDCNININLMRNGVTQSTYGIRLLEDYVNPTISSSGYPKLSTLAPLSSVRFIDTPGATANIYSINITKNSSFTMASFSISDAKLYAIEK
ncbi:MAG TPA: hypothetical protein VJN02_04010 [Gammaproteobacteria bacterium]|nr:hypothetical protein [Gammaproteobacteria bacterium]